MNKLLPFRIKFNYYKLHQQLTESLKIDFLIKRKLIIRIEFIVLNKNEEGSIPAVQMDFYRTSNFPLEQVDHPQKITTVLMILLMVIKVPRKLNKF